MKLKDRFGTATFAFCEGWCITIPFLFSSKKKSKTTYYQKRWYYEFHGRKTNHIKTDDLERNMITLHQVRLIF